MWDLQATNPLARAALWDFVFGVDLVVISRFRRRLRRASTPQITAELQARFNGIFTRQTDLASLLTRFHASKVRIAYRSPPNLPHTDGS